MLYSEMAGTFGQYIDVKILGEADYFVGGGDSAVRRTLMQLFDEDMEKVEDGIYTGLMYGLEDPYSVYYNEKDYQSMMEDTTGEYCGIGAMVSQNRSTSSVRRSTFQPRSRRMGRAPHRARARAQNSPPGPAPTTTGGTSGGGTAGGSWYRAVSAGKTFRFRHRRRTAFSFFTWT